MNIKILNTKSVITKSNLPDADYVINPYIGCQHACIYCYADFMKRFTGHSNEEWGSFVDIKINSSLTIKNPNFKDKTLLIGSVTDPYQQLEGKYKITESILKELISYQPNIEILTKSGLILRDIELFKKFTNLKIGISLNTLNSSTARILEPYASSPKIRIEALKKLHLNGIKTYLFISPIFPYITNYKEIVAETKDFVDEYLFENLNIRANNRLKIKDFLTDNYPELLSHYEDIQQGSPFWKELEQDINIYCNENNIKFKIYFRHNEKKITSP